MSQLILVVDDEPDQRELLQEILEHEGYRVTLAATGAQALAILASECPDGVLLDFYLGDMNGHEFIRRARLVSKRVPPFLLTTGVHPSKAAGVADAVLYKPLDIDAVVTTLRHLCPPPVLRQGHQDRHPLISGAAAETSEMTSS